MVGYVDAVMPDSSITISYIDNLEPGTFHIETLQEPAWREWRPVFIEIT